MSVSTTCVFFSADLDLWQPLGEVIDGLGLELREGWGAGRAPAALARRDRFGLYGAGWLRLPSPWPLERAFARRLARALDQPLDVVHLRASAPLGADSACFTLESPRARRMQPSGAEEPLRADFLRHPLRYDDAGVAGLSDPVALREAVEEFLAETAGEALAELRQLPLPMRLFRLREPKGWVLPDSFSLNEDLGPAAWVSRATLHGAEGARPLPSAALIWLAWSAQEAGLLDEELPEPELSRWTPRVLRRLELDAEPPEGSPRRAEWEATWARFTAKERGALSHGGRRVPAWKLSRPGRWTLHEEELARLRTCAERGLRGPQRELAELLMQRLPEEGDLELSLG